MPRFFQVDAAAFAHQRPPRVHGIAQLCSGKNSVQLHQHIVVVEDGLPRRGALTAEHPQDTVDLLVLLGLQLLHLVVGLHHAHGLHKQCGAGGGHIVDKAWQTALALRFHRHHESAVPLGDEGLLQHLGVGWRGDDALQDLAALGGRHPHLPPDVRQLGAGSVGDGLLVQDGPADAVLQIFIGPQGGEQPVDGRGFPLPLRIVVADPPCGCQHAGNIQQLPCVQHTAVVGAVQRLRHNLHAGEGRAAVEPQPHLGGVCLVQQMADRLRLGGGPQPAAPLLGLVADGPLSQQLQHGGQLQRPHGFFK